MNNVVAMPERRQVGSLTSSDLGKTINADGTIMTVRSISHAIDERSGTEYTILYDNVSLLFPQTMLSDVLFTVED